MVRFLVTLAAVGLGIAAPLRPAPAQDAFPSRPITMLVPAAAGGPSDTVARLVGEVMSQDLGQRVVIENMGGAGGSLGAGRVAAASPDGYTLLLYHVGVATFAALYPKLPYRPAEAFDPVGLVTEVPLTLVGRRTLVPSDLPSLVDWLKGPGAGATIGTAGIGAVSDLCVRALAEAFGFRPTVVPYRGTGPAMNDLVSGQLDLMCDQTTSTANQIESGAIKPFAVTTRERVALLPDLPTLREGGAAGVDLSAWHAVWAPKGTPEAVRLKLAASLRAALADRRVIERFAALGTAPVAPELATPEALGARFGAEITRWNGLLAGAGEK